VLVIALLVVGVFLTATALAEGGEAHQSKSLWELFRATGIVGILIVTLSIAGTALSIEHAIHIREDQLAPPHLVAEVEDLINQGEIEQAAQVAQADPSYFGKIVGAGLTHVGTSLEEGVNSLETKAMEETFNLNAKISYISLVGNLGPLIGLLGTVTGMISSFQVIEKLKAPTPKDLAVGVYESLVNTTMGLFVAIIFLVVFFLFKNRVQRLTLAVNAIGLDLLRRVAG
jgi:biopolymer transport protein ExbB